MESKLVHEPEPDKAEVRRRLKGAVAGMPEEHRAREQAALLETLKTRLQPRSERWLLAPLPLPDEPDWTPVLSWWLTRGRLGLARTEGADLAFVEVHDLGGPWRVKGRLREPVGGEPWSGEPAVALVPGLGFCWTPQGVLRLGRGGGYYDRWLAQHNVVSVGVGWSVQRCPDLPLDAWDRPLQALVLGTQGWQGRD